MDEEIKTVVVSGNCRSEDVTLEGTVQSNQLANLALVVNHEGEVNKAARKGWLTKALDAVLPF
jgi:flagellar basal body L-ring protein FlgH